MGEPVPRRIFELGSEVSLAWSMNFPMKLLQQQDRYPFLPGQEGIEYDLWNVGSRSGFPARVMPGKPGRSDYLRIYVDGRYALTLNETRNQRGYSIDSIHPLSLTDHDQIVRSSLVLRAGRWAVYPHSGDLPYEQRSWWGAITSAWNAAADQSEAVALALPEHHAQYLDRLEMLVEQGRRLELSGKNASRLCSYRRLDATAARRRSASSVYSFQLFGLVRLTVGARVHIDGEPDLRGEVEDLHDGLARVRFERPVDYARIPKVGSFVASPNTISYDKQAQALEILREGHSYNPHLLDVLVDHAFQPFQPAAAATPKERLDPSQLSAFHKALDVPDLALVLGPPGTGKTRTIRQIAYACAATRRKVLIAAYTNQAVDNVLKELGPELTIVRVGSGVTPDCERLTLEAQARALQQRILERTEPLLHRLASSNPDGGEATLRIRDLTAELERLTDLEAQTHHAADEAAARDALVTAGQRLRLDALGTAVVQHQAALTQQEQETARLGAVAARADRRAAVRLIGVLFRKRAAGARDRFEIMAGELARTRQTLATIERDRTTAQRDLAEAREHDAVLGELVRRHEQIDARRRKAAEHAADVAQPLRTLLSVLLGQSPNSAETKLLPDVAAEHSALAAFLTAAERATALAHRRFQLLTKWREKLERRTEQLYPELIRYADVVGATCIAAATADYVKDVGFDLAVIDEAGQISTPDLLVPLVRARRAVLVGDHLQLPPYHEPQMKEWAGRQRPYGAAMEDLVTKSAFELLFPAVPAQNREVLRYQRRMPEVLARFISAHFYNGFLETADVDRPWRDELFAAPIVLVDTSGLATSKRRERRPRPDEPWKPDSRVNEAEAEIIADLASHYHRRVGDWAVIVPFSAQVGMVTDMLAHRLGNETAVAARVASVDSFQGGEHDTVIFGFTRSNTRGDIGFLDDLRRSNVAFSRARHRLIVVGDTSTLANASDPAFRSFAQAFLEHVRAFGDLQPSPQTVLRLAGEAGR
ncbi:ATP-binding protein [Actinocrinis puniceicyclus]|uniref:ATP-binding protein n=1 Tax=Actinocrinis puniceicyclus TaxID=977794 RepID=A0A8J7WSR8_9ACTN|nr:ATP-binding protein [Actinocrinis puniceicyclus]MBS2966933.1 ATP-binding protein [Actinocrinis puniceicyclus]